MSKVKSLWRGSTRMELQPLLSPAIAQASDQLPRTPRGGSVIPISQRKQLRAREVRAALTRQGTSQPSWAGCPHWVLCACGRQCTQAVLTLHGGFSKTASSHIREAGAPAVGLHGPGQGVLRAQLPGASGPALPLLLWGPSRATPSSDSSPEQRQGPPSL